MSRFVEVQAKSSIKLSEAVQALSMMERTGEAFLENAARIMHALYLNRSLLKDALRAELRQNRSMRTVFYSPQSFFLATGKFSDGEAFTLRGNVWFPRSFDGDNQRLEDYVYSYDNCHDHNFDFLTVGYEGPGYLTDLYEYDGVGMQCAIDTPVELRPVGSVVLAPGKVLHFRRSRDVHVQRYPEALSVSLNLLMPDKELHRTAQYEFDPDKGVVMGAIYSSSMHYASACFMAGEVGAKDVAQALFTKLRGSPMWQLRHAAGRAYHLAHRVAADELDGRLDLPTGMTVAKPCRY